MFDLNKLHCMEVMWNPHVLDNSLLWRRNGRDCVSNHQPHDCLLSRLFRHISKKISKLRVTGLSAGNSPVTDEFPAQMASNAENVSIWWRHHVSQTPLTVWRHSKWHAPPRFTNAIRQIKEGENYVQESQTILIRLYNLLSVCNKGNNAQAWFVWYRKF